jgi:L-alanine-DL-glutamate epimerase-like enolase superfamily enzyme
MVVTGLQNAAPAGLASGIKIAVVEALRLKLPYKKAVSFRSVTEAGGQYVILRLALAEGSEGLAEAVCRAAMSGEDAASVAYQIETFFRPLLMGADPMGNLALMSLIQKVRGCRAAKALIDIALWDLRGKLLGQPVWRLLGGSAPEPVPLTWIAHGNTREAQVAEARRMTEERGYRGMKLKTWRRSLEDVRMVAEVRGRARSCPRCTNRTSPSSRSPAACRIRPGRRRSRRRCRSRCWAINVAKRCRRSIRSCA